MGTWWRTVCLMILATLGCAQQGTDSVMRLPPRQCSVPIETHREIRKILERPESVAWKLKALEPYVKIGDTSQEVESKLGDLHDFDAEGAFPMSFRYDYRHLDGHPGLVLYFNPDGILYAIGYWNLDEKETATRGCSFYTVTFLGGQ